MTQQISSKNKQRPDRPGPESASRPNKPGDGSEADEIGGPKGLEPTRYGDWENKGRCIDF